MACFMLAKEKFCMASELNSGRVSPVMSKPKLLAPVPNQDDDASGPSSCFFSSYHEPKPVDAIFRLRGGCDDKGDLMIRFFCNKRSSDGTKEVGLSIFYA